MLAARRSAGFQDFQVARLSGLRVARWHWRLQVHWHSHWQPGFAQITDWHGILLGCRRPIAEAALKGQAAAPGRLSCGQCQWASAGQQAPGPVTVTVACQWLVPVTVPVPLRLMEPQ